MDGAVTVAAFIIPVGALSNGIKAWALIKAAIGSVNALLLVNDFKQIVEDNLGETAVQRWNNICFFLTTKESPLEDIAKLKLTSATAFFATWTIFKSSDKYNYLISSEASKEAIEMAEYLMDELKKIQ